MRLEITRRSDLATRALLTLVTDGKRTKASHLAARIGTTPGFLTQAIAPLVQKGWVRSDPGPSGGYVATLDPKFVSVLDVIEAVEGLTEDGQCVLEGRPCAGAAQCAMHKPWSNARTQLMANLAGTPLSSLLPAGK